MVKFLIPPAGQARNARPADAWNGANGEESRSRMARQMFKGGVDTYDIAKTMGIGEHLALKWIHEERTREWWKKTCS